MLHCIGMSCKSHTKMMSPHGSAWRGPCEDLLTTVKTKTKEARSCLTVFTIRDHVPITGPDWILSFHLEVARQLLVPWWRDNFHVFSNVRGAYLWLDNKTRKLYECLNEYFKNGACFWPGKNHVVYDPVREAIKDKKPPEKGWCLTTTLKNGQSWSWLTPRAETWERCQSDLVLKFSKDAPNT